MSLKDTLTSRLGDRMRASMGAGEGAAPEANPVGPPGTKPQAAGRNEGLKAFRAAALIPLDRLVPDPDQPRKTFTDEEIDRLSESLRTRGLLQPIRARWDAELERWVIVAGERRYRAACRAGWTEIACVTLDTPPTLAEIRMDQLIENCLREDLKPLEQAVAFRALMESEGWSARRLATELNLSHQTVDRAVALLDLPAEVRGRVERGELSPRAASEIASLPSPAEQVELAERAVAERLTRDQVAENVQARRAGRPMPAKAAKVEVRLKDGIKVTVAGLSAGSGADAVADALRRAARQVQAAAKAAESGEGRGEAA